MPWLALPFGDDHKQTLSEKYGVRGIPMLVIIDAEGELITKNGRGDVSSKGADTFEKWVK
jgi:nucleoredoxin